MGNAACRAPVLARFYQHYLSDEDAARFIKAVSERYTIAALERLALAGSRGVRRAAMLALGFLAPYESNPVFARALHDRDRGVRILAAAGMPELWRRAAGPLRQKLRIVTRLNASRRSAEAVERAGRLLVEAPGLAEAWNERAIGYYHLQRYEESIRDSLQTLHLNPFHFAAAVRIGHCRLETQDVFAALEFYRRALELNPNLYDVRTQIHYLERTLEGK